MTPSARRLPHQSVVIKLILNTHFVGILIKLLHVQIEMFDKKKLKMLEKPCVVFLVLLFGGGGGVLFLFGLKVFFLALELKYIYVI